MRGWFVIYGMVEFGHSNKTGSWAGQETPPTTHDFVGRSPTVPAQ